MKLVPPGAAGDSLGGAGKLRSMGRGAAKILARWPHSAHPRVEVKPNAAAANRGRVVGARTWREHARSSPGTRNGYPATTMRPRPGYGMADGNDIAPREAKLLLCQTEDGRTRVEGALRRRDRVPVPAADDRAILQGQVGHLPPHQERLRGGRALGLEQRRHYSK